MCLRAPIGFVEVVFKDVFGVYEEDVTKYRCRWENTNTFAKPSLFLLNLICDIWLYQ